MSAWWHVLSNQCKIVICLLFIFLYRYKNTWFYISWKCYTDFMLQPEWGAKMTLHVQVILVLWILQYVPQSEDKCSCESSFTVMIVCMKSVQSDLWDTVFLCSTFKCETALSNNLAVNVLFWVSEFQHRVISLYTMVPPVITITSLSLWRAAHCQREKAFTWPPVVCCKAHFV